MIVPFTEGKSALAPVIKAELFIHSREIRVALLHVLDERCLDIGAARIVGFRLIVQLVADDGRMVLHVIDQCHDHPLRCVAKSLICYVHILPTAVFGTASRCNNENLRMLPSEPCRNRVGWRSHNHLDPCLIHCGEHAINRLKSKTPAFGPRALHGDPAMRTTLMPVAFIIRTSSSSRSDGAYSS